jgi:6-phosphogluconolactonase
MKIKCAILLSFFAISIMKSQENKFNLIVGTYTNSCESKGIYVYEFDSITGDFSFKNSSENIVNPSFLTVDPSNHFVYSVSENGKKTAVSAFGFDSKSGKLNFLNSSQTKGDDSCYIINDDKNVITANYTGGSISVFGKNSDGSITEVKQVVQHTGKGINAERQGSPHVHMVYFSPDKKYVLANDLGTDQVSVYQYNPNGGNQILKLKSSIAVNPGSGPRHLTFSKDGKYVYVLQELDGALVAFSYNNGMLKKVFETTIIAKDYKGEIRSADIHISPDGKFLYATNRGEIGEISIFKTLKKGALELVGRTSTLGKGPRNFAIDPTGNFLLVGHQYTNEIVIFKRDKTTGSITDTGKRIPLCSPVCLVFGKI